MLFLVLVSLQQSCFKICILTSGILYTEFGNTSKMKCYLVEIVAQVKIERGKKKFQIYASEKEKTNCFSVTGPSKPTKQKENTKKTQQRNTFRIIFK